MLDDATVITLRIGKGRRRLVITTFRYNVATAPDLASHRPGLTPEDSLRRGLARVCADRLVKQAGNLATGLRCDYEGS